MSVAVAVAARSVTAKTWSAEHRTRCQYGSADACGAVLWYGQRDFAGCYWR